MTDSHYARRTREIHESSLLDNPINLSAWFPQMPYFNSPNFGHALEEYYNKRDACWKDLEKYDALLLPGGSGPMVDMVNNERLHDVILGFVAQDKLIAAECYCVTCLAFARDWTERKSIIWGKHVTGHAREYDYKDCTGFAQMYGYDGQPMNTSANFGPPFYPLEYILRDAVGPERPVSRRRRSHALHDPGLSLPDRPLDPGLAPGRRDHGAGVGEWAAAVWVVSSGRQVEVVATAICHVPVSTFKKGTHHDAENRSLRDPRTVPGRWHRPHVRQSGTVEQGFLDALSDYPTSSTS